MDFEVAKDCGFRLPFEEVCIVPKNILSYLTDIKILLPFLSTYVCEARFSLVLQPN